MKTLLISMSMVYFGLASVVTPIAAQPALVGSALAPVIDRSGQDAIIELADWRKKRIYRRDDRRAYFPWERRAPSSRDPSQRYNPRYDRPGDGRCGPNSPAGGPCPALPNPG